MRLEQLLLSAATAEPVCRNGDSTQTSRQIRVQNKIRTDYDSLKAQMMVNIKKKAAVGHLAPISSPRPACPRLLSEEPFSLRQVTQGSSPLPLRMPRQALSCS